LIYDLATLLRPAGGGIHVVSTGVAEQLALSMQIYRASDREGVDTAWREAISRLGNARAVVLGVPSDVGAGFARGASFGPQRIREALIADPKSRYHREDVIDVGDVFVVPQLLHDDMLSSAQADMTRRAVYGSEAASDLPVSPLSIASAALATIRELAPNAAPLILGGDHSVGWPGLSACAAGREQQTGILHFDAHTDLLAERLGVRYCFATWAYHANELVGRGGRLAQVGIRISGKTRAHWEETQGVRQYWMDEVNARPLDAIADEIIGAFESAGVEGIYVSNDIDGTDPEFGAATGTPEPGGLRPETVIGLIERVGARFELWGSDLVEVAPTLGHSDPAEPGRTTAMRPLGQFLDRFVDNAFELRIFSSPSIL
jgi:agmatinase